MGVAMWFAGRLSGSGGPIGLARVGIAAAGVLGGGLVVAAAATAFSEPLAALIPGVIGLFFALGAVWLWRLDPAHYARWAWLLLLLFPAALAAAIVVEVMMADALGLAWSDLDEYSASERMQVVVPALPALVSVQFVGLCLGAQAGRTGHRAGTAAAVVNGLLIGVLVFALLA